MNASRVTHGDVGLYSGVIAPRFVLVSVHGWALTLPIQGCSPRIHLGVGPVCLDGPEATALGLQVETQKTADAGI